MDEPKSAKTGIFNLHERLRRESHRITGPRRAILKILEAEARPQTTKEIHAALTKGDCDLATVYRFIQMLEQIGVVKRFHFGDGAARYALLVERAGSHHHHLVCTACAKIVEIGGCMVRELEQRVVAGSRFKAVTHRLEFFGVCPECQ